MATSTCTAPSPISDGPPSVSGGSVRADGSLRKEVRVKAGWQDMFAPRSDAFRSLRVQAAKDNGEEGKTMPKPRGYILEPGEGRKTHVVSGNEPVKWVMRDEPSEGVASQSAAVAKGPTEVEPALEDVSLAA